MESADLIIDEFCNTLLADLRGRGYVCHRYIGWRYIIQFECYNIYITIEISGNVQVFCTTNIAYFDLHDPDCYTKIINRFEELVRMYNNKFSSKNIPYHINI